MLKIGNKDLEDCTKEELVNACMATHQLKLEAVAERDAYLKILKSNFPIHKLWVETLERVLVTVLGLLIVACLIKAIK